jgi:hypothetical protein
MNNLKSGYAEININPELGIGISGYYVPRFASGILDDIKAQCLSLCQGDTAVLIISVDNCLIYTEIADSYREAIADRCGVLKDNIFLSATHTHTAPLLRNGDFFDADEDKISEYVYKNIDLRPSAIINKFDLRRPIYRQLAAYGHVGREDLDIPWEKTDIAQDIKKALL